MKHTMKTLALASVLAWTAGIGCASYDELGQSVRAITDNQIQDPHRAQYPSTDVPVGDGARTEQAIHTYRRSVSEPKTIQNEIKINVGN